MAHIQLPEEMPGITAGFAFRPETAKPPGELAHVLLHSRVMGQRMAESGYRRPPPGT